MRNRRQENDAPNYKSFIEHILTRPKLRESYMSYLYQNQNGEYVDFFTNMGIGMIDFPSDLNNLIDEISTKGIASVSGHWLAANNQEECADHFMAYQDYLLGAWNELIKEELSQIEDFNEIFQNTNEDNFNFSCEELGLSYLFSLLNSQNTATLRSTMIAQVQGTGISTEQQKKNWLINWYFENDPTSSIYLATLRNPALVASYQTSPGMLYGTPFAIGMENYFQKIKNHFGLSMFDQLLTEFAQQSNLYVDEIKVDEWHIYGSSRLGVYEANRTISKRVARDLNNDNQITNNEYVIETPEEVLFIYSSYQLERGAKRYELANHLGNVLTVISDKKTANFIGTTFTSFTAERLSATDYSPFGAPLAGRTWNGGEYRFGFGGQEKNEQVLSEGDLYSAEYWEYDSRIARRWNIDPLTAITPPWTPYRGFFNNPLTYNDPTGAFESTEVVKQDDGTYKVVGAKNDGDCNIYVVNNETEKKKTGIIGQTENAWDFMDANEETGEMEGHVEAVIDLKNIENGNKILEDMTFKWRLIANHLPSGLALPLLAILSKNKGEFDLKAKYGDKLKQLYTPVMLNGKITTARYLGNVIFGRNLRTINAVCFDQKFTPSTFFYNLTMPIAGLYNIMQNGAKFNGPPFFGEHTYSGTGIYFGYFGRKPDDE